MRLQFGIVLSTAVLALMLAPTAKAQGGSCHDPWINLAYNQMYHRAPQGSNNTGECNVTLYGQGHWSSFQDLEAKIRQTKSSACRDPWITQAYAQLYRRAPQGAGDSGECNPVLYGGGHWSSFSDLSQKIAASKRPPAPAAAGETFTVDSQLALRNHLGQVVAPPGGYVIDLGGGRLLAPSAGQVIAAGGGNVIAAGGGNVIAAGGGNFHVQSLGGKFVIHAISVRR